jgi:adenosylcobyric acid synthase
VALAQESDALFEMERAGGQSVSEGAVNADGNVVGTLLHGLFENASLRADLLSSLRRRRGLLGATGPVLPGRRQEYDRLADAVQVALDMSLLDRLIGLEQRS